MSKKESWGSRVGLILSMAGGAVGLGNFLRFPVQVVQHGGGAFIVPYLVCFLLMGIPLLFIEWSIGRYGGARGNHGTPFILNTMSRNGFWKYIGALGVFSNIAVVSYYCYIESWTMSYIYHTLIGTFSGMSQKEVASFFGSYIDTSKSTTGLANEAIVFYVICILINTYILSKGLSGIEKVAKIGMPLLFSFAVILVIKAFLLGDSAASDQFPHANAWDGFNFMWTPSFDSIWDPKVWLAAAGQIFFTSSLGMGIIHCYASYLREKDDIVLNSLSAGFMNVFTEVLLGGAIVIPIAAGYLGIDWVKENAGFGMAFQTMPYLFDQWGHVLSVIAGVLWFGLLFFAGITSSLSLGSPWVGFLQDEFKVSKTMAATTFGCIVMIVGLPTILFFEYGVFDEYDYWAGTVSFVLFALLEIILFVFVFGMEKGWKIIISGSDIQLSIAYKYIIKYITPFFLIMIFVGALIKPKNNDWKIEISRLVNGQSWRLDGQSIIKKINHADLKEALIKSQDKEEIQKIHTKIHYVNLSRGILLALLLFICLIVFAASNKRKRQILNKE